MREELVNYAGISDQYGSYSRETIPLVAGRCHDSFVHESASRAPRTGEFEASAINRIWLLSSLA
jgi:hypothetical protein